MPVSALAGSQFLGREPTGGVLTFEESLLHAVELYTLAEDPHCENDLVEEEFDRGRRMGATPVD